MKKQHNYLFLGSFLFLVAALFSNNTISITFMCAGVMQISNLIENKVVKRKVVQIYGILTILVFIFFIISRWNHGWYSDYTFKNIF